MEEIEVKFLDIDQKSIEKKLKRLGAKKEFDKFYKSKVFDYPDFRLDKKFSFIRLRDEGDKIVLTFKKRLGTKKTGENDDGMLEHETTVGNFEETTDIFIAAGFVQKYYAEKRRIRYLLNGVEFDIDFCPMLKPYLEIEAKSWEDIDKAINLLGLNPKDKKIFSATQIYDLNGINEFDYKELTFDRLVKR